MTHSYCRDVGVGMSDQRVAPLSTCTDTPVVLPSDIPTSDIRHSHRVTDHE